VLLERFPVSVGVVAGLVIALSGAFVLSLPASRSPMLTRKSPPHYILPVVRKAFARNDVLLGRTPGLYVVLAGSRAPGPRQDWSYERRIGNVLVHYGGSDPAVLARVRATVDDLDG
jgi:hypothetical protein